MAKGVEQQKLAVNSGYWNLYRFNPALTAEGKNPLILDSKAPSMSVEEYMNTETRFKTVMQTFPERAKKLAEFANKATKESIIFTNSCQKLTATNKKGR